MKIGSLFPHRKARIEIIPLIDIMFFLLASFMLASLSMIRLQSIKMDLPTASIPRPGPKPDMVNLNVKKSGDIYVEKELYNLVDLRRLLAERVKANTNVAVYIRGDPDATHGMVIGILDVVKQEGVQKVSFAITTAPKK